MTTETQPNTLVEPENQVGLRADTSVYHGKTKMIDIDKLKPSPFNPREANGTLDPGTFGPKESDRSGTCKELYEMGQETPLIVEPQADGSFEILKGHRRREAVLKILEHEPKHPLRKLECHVTAPNLPIDVKMGLIMDHASTKPLNKIERFNGARTMLKKGFNARQTGERFGKKTYWGQQVERTVICCEAVPEMLEGYRKYLQQEKGAPNLTDNNVKGILKALREDGPEAAKAAYHQVQAKGSPENTYRTPKEMDTFLEKWQSIPFAREVRKYLRKDPSANFDAFLKADPDPALSDDRN